MSLCTQNERLIKQPTVYESSTAAKVEFEVMPMSSDLKVAATPKPKHNLSDKPKSTISAVDVIHIQQPGKRSLTKKTRIKLAASLMQWLK